MYKSVEGVAEVSALLDFGSNPSEVSKAVSAVSLVGSLC